MIEKLKDIFAALKWEFDNLTGRQKGILYAAYAVFMLLFYFIGLPGHKGLLTYLAGFVVLTLLFVAFAYFLWVKILDK